MGQDLDNSSAKFVVINDTARYCLTEPLTIGLVESYWQNESAKVVNGELQLQVDSLDAEVSLLESMVSTQASIIDEKDTIIGSVDEVAKLNEKELKRAKRKAVWQSIKQAGGQVLFGVGGLSAGIGIGYIIAK